MGLLSSFKRYLVSQKGTPIWTFIQTYIQVLCLLKVKQRCLAFLWRDGKYWTFHHVECEINCQMLLAFIVLNSPMFKPRFHVRTTQNSEQTSFATKSFHVLTFDLVLLKLNLRFWGIQVLRFLDNLFLIKKTCFRLKIILKFLLLFFLNDVVDILICEISRTFTGPTEMFKLLSIP